MANHILIVKLSSLGDVIHTLPAAQALRRRFPEARISWAVERAHSGVLRGLPFIDEIIEWDRRTWGTLGDFLGRLRKRNWDLAIDFQGLFRSAFTSWAARAKRRLGFAPLREGAHWFYNERVAAPKQPLHAVEKYLRLIEPLGAIYPGLPLSRSYLGTAVPAAAEGLSSGVPVPTGPEMFPLRTAEADRADIDAWLNERDFDSTQHRLVILNPHCRKEANIWPADRFAQLAGQLLAQDDVRVAVSGGPVANQLCERIAASHGKRVWRADGAFSLLGSAELIRRASVFVTGDTGPMHIAAAVGTPIVAMFGPADPLRTGPYAADAEVLTKRLPCGPCFAKKCPLHHEPAKCMTDIGVEEVFAAAMRQMERSRSSEQRDQAPNRRRSA
ncbi:MAG: glycosyltransferase family 9 protein [Planctomycetia bacterium]|nr:glycosyltransferase family 9 protein [Planctomycetia bacterium]